MSVRYGVQFSRLAQASLDPGAPCSTALVLTLADNANALKASALVPPVVSDHRTTAMASTNTTTAAGLVAFYPPREIPAGYVTLRGMLRARRQASCTGSPTVTIYCDDSPPVDQENAAATSPRARSAAVLVLSATYLAYPFSLTIVRGYYDDVHISVWGTVDAAGASRQADISDLDITVKHLVDDGGHAPRYLPPVTVWR